MSEERMINESIDETLSGLGPVQRQTLINLRLQRDHTAAKVVLENLEAKGLIDSDGGLTLHGMNAADRAILVGGGGIKHDQDKDPWHLLPWDAARCVVKVLAFGARKYDERNWEAGMDWSRCFRAAIEHLNSWWMGENLDPETNMSHLWHAGCCIMFLIAYELRGIGRDNRP